MPSPNPGVVAPNWGLVMLDKSRTETEPGLGDPKGPVQWVNPTQFSESTQTSWSYSDRDPSTDPATVSPSW
jgi:hypothetical protein